MCTLGRRQYLGRNKRSFFTEGFSIIETIYTAKVFEGWHLHENPYLCFVLEGGNNEHRKTEEFDSTPGKIIFYYQGELHRNTNTVLDTKTINFELEPSWLSQNSIDETSLKFCTKNILTKLLLLKMYKESIQPDDHSAASIQMLLLHVCSLKDKEPVKMPGWIKTVHNFLNDEWNRTISLDELAHIAGVNPVTISKYFPKYFKCTLGEYMRRLKVAHSLAIIKNNKHSLTNVAFECGFADQSHFIRNFKAQTGFLPKQYLQLF